MKFILGFIIGISLIGATQVFALTWKTSTIAIEGTPIQSFPIIKPTQVEVEELSPLEIRLNDIEKRLETLENNGRN